MRLADIKIQRCTLSTDSLGIATNCPHQRLPASRFLFIHAHVAQATLADRTALRTELEPALKRATPETRLEKAFKVDINLSLIHI